MEESESLNKGTRTLGAKMKWTIFLCCSHRNWQKELHLWKAEYPQAERRSLCKRRKCRSRMRGNVVTSAFPFSIVKRWSRCSFGQEILIERMWLEESCGWHSWDDLGRIVAAICLSNVVNFPINREAWKETESRLMPKNSMEVLGPEEFFLWKWNI